MRESADAMSQTWSSTSSHLSMSMRCPSQGLTLTQLLVDACLNMSYTSTHLNADAMS
ncbi:hypothetical protein F383_09543 [Gossypium arboreum]|uniref:Uncharacterized protein n=1 Tax=Gossypium arboreum TaxID=29729 RepID=A0A0B0PQ62_GOSAR|nr:hypothetical protein F383_09543 [Gossypium arboreum]